MIVASAPGKLMLSGEYAVLEGAPALVAAVDRRAQVTLEIASDPGEGDALTVSSDLPGFTTLQTTLGALGATPAGAAGFVLRVLERVGVGLPSMPTLRQLDIQSAAFADRSVGAKLGLGSSAAVAVALCAGLCQHTLGTHDPATLVDLARSAHRDAAGGLGSGVDVAASAFGGLAGYRLSANRLFRAPMRLPQGVRIRVLWTGHAASTRTFLQRIRSWRERSPSDHRRALDRLGEAAEEVFHACDAGLSGRFLESIETYARAMELLGRAADVPIVSPAHARVRELARAAGAVAKPSGAGGGDVAVVFCRDRVSAQEVDDRAAQAGFRSVYAPITPLGAQVRVPATRSVA